MRKPVAVLAGCVVLAAAGACTPSAPATPARLSPAIPGDPIDLTAYVATPCGLMTGRQLAPFFIRDDGTVAPDGNGRECRWTPADTTALTYRASVRVGADGLEDVYRRRTTFPAFEPTSVHSYPAVHTDIGTGRCTVMVGVAGDTVLTARVEVTDPKLTAYGDACTEADRFAGAVIGYQGHRAP